MPVGSGSVYGNQTVNQSSAGLTNSSFLGGLSGFDDDFCMMDDLNEHDMGTDKPHETVKTSSKRDTPIKRNALATKQKNTVRNTRASSPKK